MPAALNTSALHTPLPDGCSGERRPGRPWLSTPARSTHHCQMRTPRFSVTPRTPLNTSALHTPLPVLSAVNRRSPPECSQHQRAPHTIASRYLSFIRFSGFKLSTPARSTHHCQIAEVKLALSGRELSTPARSTHHCQRTADLLSPHTSTPLNTSALHTPLPANAVATQKKLTETASQHQRAPHTIASGILTRNTDDDRALNTSALHTPLPARTVRRQFAPCPGLSTPARSTHHCQLRPDGRPEGDYHLSQHQRAPHTIASPIGEIKRGREQSSQHQRAPHTIASGYLVIPEGAEVEVSQHQRAPHTIASGRSACWSMPCCSSQHQRAPHTIARCPREAMRGKKSCPLNTSALHTPLPVLAVDRPAGVRAPLNTSALHTPLPERCSGCSRKHRSDSQHQRAPHTIASDSTGVVEHPVRDLSTPARSTHHCQQGTREAHNG